ncbi:hypothetical protein PR202_ga19863 [Eleusine coracana subsp. coracana]|uniref:Amine oxidase domain-containing protein n=1 Tax=Eleusine coracana subsp. coracana TaxID=191504 RepID=A0AAV5CV52_ELECO|nr:hypothetical protein PR202_ga19863 [Eleusine coracana subsp. coracana]
MLSSTSTASSASAHPYRPASTRAMAGSDDTRAAPARSVAVVGAGVSGLAAAYRLRKSGVNVTVFEAGDRAGGKIRSNSEGGFLWDEGANTMVSALFVFVAWNLRAEMVLQCFSVAVCFCMFWLEALVNC